MPPRLRVAGVQHHAGADGIARVRVSLSYADRDHLGEARGVVTREGDLRTAAEATLKAVSSATGGRLRLGLVGIKAIRAFDSWIVVSSVEARAAERHYKLVGARAAEDDDMVEGSVLSILDALNRVIELHLT